MCARIVNVERLTDAAAKVQKGLRVFVRDETPLESIEPDRAWRGRVSLVLILGPQEGEVEIRLPGHYSVSAAIAGALKAAPGVVAVEQV
jgi:DNA polymerase-3 subunit alpha